MPAKTAGSASPWGFLGGAENPLCAKLSAMGDFSPWNRLAIRRQEVEVMNHCASALPRSFPVAFI